MKAGAAEPGLARPVGKVLQRRTDKHRGIGTVAALTKRALVELGQGSRGPGSRVPTLQQRGRCTIYF